MANVRNTIDISKFRKDITKSIDGISIGFESDPEIWISSGCYLMNWMISGDFNKGVPLGRATLFAGESGAGKSFVSSGNLIANAQKLGVMCVLIDTEAALDEEWLKNLGVDTAEDKLIKINASLVDDVSKIISDFMKGYEADYGKVAIKDQPPVLFVVDSLGMLMTRVEIEQAESGNLKGDMGHKAKALKRLITYSNSKFQRFNVGMVATNHTYASQDMYNPDPKISGGAGFIYAASIVLLMAKSKLKEDEDGNKVTGVKGIRARCKTQKTRFNPSGIEQAFEVKIRFDSGMEPYSGLFEFFEGQNILVKEGNRYSYEGPSGSFKEFRKNITDEQFDILMKDYTIVKDKMSFEAKITES